MKRIVLVILTAVVCSMLAVQCGHACSQEHKRVWPNVSIGNLMSLSCPITSEQKELLARVLWHQDDLNINFCDRQDMFIRLTLAASVVISVVCMILLLDQALDQSGTKYQDLNKYCAFATLVPVATGSAAVLVPLYKKMYERKLFQQFLDEGCRLEIARVAQPILTLIEECGQQLCRQNCSVCNVRRSECRQCGILVAGKGYKQAMCNDCWYTVCSGCMTCKRLREDDSSRALTRQLNLTIVPDQNNINHLKRYLHCILNKQCHDAYNAV